MALMKRLVIGAALLAASVSAFAQAPFPAVTNTNDAGPGSLRQAILDVNASCLSAPQNLTVSFAIAGTGPFRIQPLSPLPTITCPGTIDGYTQAGSSPNSATDGTTNAVIQIELDGSLCNVRGLPCNNPGLDVQANGVTISGLAIHSFAGPGIGFTTPQIIFGILTVNGNFIGTDPGGSSSLGNAVAGIDVVSGQLSAGDLLPANRNLITANKGPGINVQSGASFSVNNNLIGGRRDGTSGAGNSGAGIATASVFSNNTVAANYIRFNGGSGVLVTGAAPNISGPPPANPSIFGNGGPGIDYPAGAPIAPPTITSFVYDPVSNTTTINATAPASSLLFPNIVDFYHNAAMPPFGEGQLFVARGNVDANGRVTVTVPGQATFVTATFTSCGDGCFGTSPFSLADFPPTLAIAFAPNPLNFGNVGTVSMVLQNPNKTRTLGLV
ncbi:MAG TPA: right-handed parallel beta-helix repeat-containing protein, partial [Usitatibacter sp.]|nr:right-handed parallel beta-helix repeat-containing protein [Usitatibacter sp.]